MSRVMCLSDIHASDRPPSSCTDTYTDDLFTLLGESMELADKFGVSLIVWAGDVFHHKAPGRTSHRLVQRMIRLIQDAPCPVAIVPGNHDLQNDRLDSLDQTQPLGVLFQAGAIPLNGWCPSVLYGELPVYGVPWLQGYGNWDTQENAANIDHAVQGALARFREAPGRGKMLVVTHAPLYPPGKELPYEYFPADRWAAAMGGQGKVFYGHVHEPHGVYKVQCGGGSVTFCNNGALSRGSLHEYNLARQVGVTIWDSETGNFEFCPLVTAPPAEKVFRLEEKAQVTDMQGKLDQFLEGIGETSLGVVSVESVQEHIRSLGLGTEAENLVEELLAYAAAGRKNG